VLFQVVVRPAEMNRRTRDDFINSSLSLPLFPIHLPSAASPLSLAENATFPIHLRLTTLPAPRFFSPSRLPSNRPLVRPSTPSIRTRTHRHSPAGPPRLAGRSREGECLDRPDNAERTLPFFSSPTATNRTDLERRTDPPRLPQDLPGQAQQGFAQEHPLGGDGVVPPLGSRRSHRSSFLPPCPFLPLTSLSPSPLPRSLPDTSQPASPSPLPTSSLRTRNNTSSSRRCIGICKMRTGGRRDGRCRCFIRSVGI
jgi:hypothetical protein